MGRFETFGLRNDLLAGARFERIDCYRKTSVRGPNVGGFDPFAPVYGLIGASDRVSLAAVNNRDRLGNTSLYLQDSLHLTDRLILVGGISTQIYDQIAYAGRPAVISTAIDGVKPVPRAGLVYKLAPNLSLYGSCTQSFRPNVTDLAVTGALPPEEGTAYEVGVKAEVADGVLITGAMFDAEKSHVPITQVIDGTRFGSAVDRVRSRGFELDFAGQILPDWAVIGSRYVGARPGDATNSFSLPDYAVCDAFRAYRTQVNGLPTSLQLNLKNLFDEACYPSSGASNLLVAVGEPFQALVTARIVW